MKYTQMEFDFVFPAAPRCSHDVTFLTHAVIPAGLACSRCGELVLQYIPEPPEQLGYVSADWNYLYGNGEIAESI